MNTHAPSTQVNAFAWGDIALSQVVHIDGIPHATRRAIGEWLEYADPQKAIDNILDRNPHLKDYSVALKLSATDGKSYNTEVYHPIGLLLIVMESGQPRAHVKKTAVAEFVWRFAGPKTMSDKARLDQMKMRLALLDRLANCRDAFVCAAMLKDLQDLSVTLGLPLPNVELLGKDAKQMSLTLG